FRINPDKVRLADADDELYFNTDKSAFVPDANFGVYLTNSHIYTGLSMMQLFQSSLKIGGNGGVDYRMVRHYYVTAGYRFEVMPDVLIEPSFLIKFTEDFVSQADLNVKTYLGEKYWLGVSYRTGGSYSLVDETINGRGTAVVLMAGLKIDKFFIGYSFDHTFSAISARTYGSHEIMAAVKFGDNARRYRWLNRY
ncbi:MAG: type IX secretion system membrane protein PorP/SprF, partial [Nitrosopumilales archaeon]